MSPARSARPGPGVASQGTPAWHGDNGDRLVECLEQAHIGNDEMIVVDIQVGLKALGDAQVGVSPTVLAKSRIALTGRQQLKGGQVGNSEQVQSYESRWDISAATKREAMLAVDGSGNEEILARSGRWDSVQPD